jgi:nitroreductase
MDVYDAILKRRSIRRFKQRDIPFEVLKKLVNAARMAPSGGNLQPWEYVVVAEEELLEKVFSTLRWENITKGGAPPKEKMPTSFIIVLINREIKPEGGEYDVAMAAQNIMLTALEEGVGTCCIGPIDKDRLKEILKIPEMYEIALVIALGYPDESPIIENVEDSTIYWRDDRGVLHVPKRKLDMLIHRNIF